MQTAGVRTVGILMMGAIVQLSNTFLGEIPRIAARSSSRWQVEAAFAVGRIRRLKSDYRATFALF
jgi:hypothetical protein